MDKKDLMEYVGKRVVIRFFDDSHTWGVLKFIDKFSAENDFLKVNSFHIGSTTFKASHVKKIELTEYLRSISIKPVLLLSDKRYHLYVNVNDDINEESFAGSKSFETEKEAEKLINDINKYFKLSQITTIEELKKLV